MVCDSGQENLKQQQHTEGNRGPYEPCPQTPPLPQFLLLH